MLRLTGNVFLLSRVSPLAWQPSTMQALDLEKLIVGQPIGTWGRVCQWTPSTVWVNGDEKGEETGKGKGKGTKKKKRTWLKSQFESSARFTTRATTNSTKNLQILTSQQKVRRKPPKKKEKKKTPRSTSSEKKIRLVEESSWDSEIDTP